MTNKFYGLLGLSAKAGKVASGAFAVEKAIKSGEAFLVIVAEDASESTREDYSKLCNGYEVDCQVYGKKDDLGNAIGKDERAAVAILDEGFAKALVKKTSVDGED